MMAKIARDYDKGYAHISTRQNVPESSARMLTLPTAQRCKRRLQVLTW